MAYQTVSTTGIYCRPDCTARPLPEHVATVGSPAAAEAAGFRACHRCRPYRDAAVRLDAGSDLVCRAVQLVLEGALDDATEADLARRLHVSPRHLRRLFVEHVGATADQLARSQRAHFARRLLDDTDLPVAEVAFAAGFRSFRTMNRVMADVFRDSPTALRARRRRADRLAADGGLALRVPFAPPLDFDALRTFFGARAIAGVEAVRDGVYRRTARIDGYPGVVEVAAGDDRHLRLVVHLPRWQGLIHHVGRVRRMFGLDTDVAASNAAFGDDPVLGPLIARRPGLRVPGCWDPFETGVRVILGQQVSVAGATTLAGRLAAAFGEPVAGLDAFGLDRLFPEAGTIARADLAGIGIPRARAATIRAFAERVAAGDLVLDGSVDLDSLVASLTAIEGVGDWTAHALAMRLGERDAWPASDLGLRIALGSPGERATPAAVQAAGDAWRPWRARAAALLWDAVSSRAGSPPRRRPAQASLRPPREHGRPRSRALAEAPSRRP